MHGLLPHSAVARAVHFYNALAFLIETEQLQARAHRNHGVE